MAYDPARDATIVVLANVYTDAHCGGPADSIVMLIIQELGSLGP
jgi:hypothetical protein